LEAPGFGDGVKGEGRTGRGVGGGGWGNGGSFGWGDFVGGGFGGIFRGEGEDCARAAREEAIKLTEFIAIPGGMMIEAGVNERDG